jgi:hypothetical protein
MAETGAMIVYTHEARIEFVTRQPDATRHGNSLLMTVEV